LTVLDAYAVIAYLRGEPAAAAVRSLLESGDAQLTAVGVSEVLDHLIRLFGADEDDAVLDLAQLGLLEPPALDAAVAANSGRLRARYYHRKLCAISMADCVAAETARAAGAALATADPQLLDVCDAENIDVVVLCGSDGSVWKPRML
jgi:predicted nucleic acid-binding protein